MRLKVYRGKWAIVWVEGKVSKRRSLGTTDRQAAERALADYKNKPAGNTVAEITAIYLRNKERTSRSYRSMLASWKATEPTFGHLRPDQITRDLCVEYARQRRKRGIKDGTIIRDLGMVKAAIRWNKNDQGAVFELPASPAPRQRYLSRTEYDQLLAAAVLPHVRLFIILALATAGRAGAILGLTYNRVDFARGQIQLGDGQSGRKGRATVPMTDRARQALQDAYEARDSDYVISLGGHGLKTIGRGFEAACRRAGLSGVTPHVLRHTAAVWLCEAGTPMSEVSQYLGHANSRVTEAVYGRYSPEHLRKASKALE